ncbi:hypothetical protein [Paenibacillus sp. IHBB 3054]|uniref:hypothetical protein n=1 Tax=Paenibacillus sp. IHBB 3054 TaxID=3425689 RepID=UPI003F662F36
MQKAFAYGRFTHSDLQTLTKFCQRVAGNIIGKEVHVGYHSRDSEEMVLRVAKEFGVEQIKK